MDQVHNEADRKELHLPAITGTEAEEVKAWEQIENGRFRPRRIRGSFRGRELG
jgi:hypothetical protein